MVTWNNELYHYGMPRRSGRYKWGSGKDPYHHGAGRKKYVSLSPSSIKARRENKKIDKSFKKWKEGAANRDNAIKLGKQANEKKITYERDRTKTTKAEYKTANREYKKALRKNTSYRRGTVRQEVGRDMSRKYLKEAKLHEKGSGARERKAYNRYMVKHDKERAKARKAQSVGQARSSKKASAKRAFKIALKVSVTAAAVKIGKAGLRSAATRVYSKYYNEPINTDSMFDSAMNFASAMNNSRRYFY